MTATSLPVLEDASKFIAVYLRKPRNNQISTYGYEIYLTHVIVDYLVEVERSTSHSYDLYNGDRARAVSPIFFEAAWDYCRRGILRPGLRTIGLQVTDEGSSGCGYTLTQFGREWLDAGSHDFLIADSSRVSQLFQSVAGLFGRGFHQRAVEAAQCHRLAAYLSCCVMCGAAAESILLAAAVTKSGDEDATLALYRSANGRKKVTDYVIGKARQAIAEPFRSATGLLSYWRDEAAHGTASQISEIEAHEALARLLRFAQFTSDNWAELTT